MARDTSIEAYRYILEHGVLSDRRLQVYAVLFDHGPLTANETYEHLSKQLGRRFRFDSNTRARFTELREMGAIKELGTRICSVTGRNVILWDVTSKYPTKIQKKQKERCLMCGK